MKIYVKEELSGPSVLIPRGNKLFNKIEFHTDHGSFFYAGDTFETKGYRPIETMHEQNVAEIESAIDSLSGMPRLDAAMQSAINKRNIQAQKAVDENMQAIFGLRAQKQSYAIQ